MRFGVAIIGAGLIGRKRARAIADDPSSRLVATVDTDLRKAEGLAADFGGEAGTDWENAVSRKDVDVVIVATYNKFLAPISIAALEHGKHVLCEKPLGRTSGESQAMIEAAARKGRILKPGFNHRYHPAIAEAKRIQGSGRIGKLCFMRCRYGHGGRPGYNREWRGSMELCGGWELMDQGIHVVDLFRWFAGDFAEATGAVRSYVWEMEVEDNAFACFTAPDDVVATLHASCTQWKNLFSFEVFGTAGYVTVEGLGGSYGAETLRVGKRRPEGGRPDETVCEYPETDVSWAEEWRGFISAIREGSEPVGNARDGYMANRMLEAVYRSASLRRAVSI
jgi:predicted dehydrogenase